MSNKAPAKPVSMQHGHMDFSAMEKAEVSKTLYGQIQWEQLPSSGVFLQHKDHQLLERAQSNLSVVLDNATDAKEYISILLKIAESCTTNVVVQQYVYTRMEEILGLSQDSKDDVNSDAFGIKHSALFAVEGGKRVNDNCFSRALTQSSDIYLQRACSEVYAALLSQLDGNANALIIWMTNKLASASNGVWEMALPALAILTRTDKCKAQLIRNNIVFHLVTVLKRLGVNGNSQHLYDLVFVLWTLSLGMGDAEEESFLHNNVICAVIDLLAASPSRKITRMCICTLRNLAERQTDKILNEMYTAGVMRIVDNFSSNNAMKQMNDPEVDADFKVLSDLLHRNYRELSSFERWVSEIESGGLRWGILHTEKFWKENVKFVENNNFAYLKALIAHLSNPDPTVVCIALYDLGEFTRFYPNGRVVVSRLGGKDIVMKMMSNENEEIQRHVLQCVSKIMVNNWEHLH